MTSSTCSASAPDATRLAHCERELDDTVAAADLASRDGRQLAPLAARRSQRDRAIVAVGSGSRSDPSVP